MTAVRLELGGLSRSEAEGIGNKLAREYVGRSEHPWTYSFVELSPPPTAEQLALHRRHVCTHCGQSWDNPDHVCACNMGVRHRRLAAEYVRQYIENCGPKPGDPFDADLWMHEAACLLGQIAGTP